MHQICGMNLFNCVKHYKNLLQPWWFAVFSFSQKISDSNEEKMLSSDDSHKTSCVGGELTSWCRGPQATEKYLPKNSYLPA